MLILLLGLQLFAQNHYPMIVTKEARVSSPNSSTTEVSRPLKCSTEQNVTAPKKRLTWVGPKSLNPENVLKISNDSMIVATRNFDDYYLNSVSLWLAQREGQRVIYYELSEINMELYELPQVQKVNGGLVIQARTMVPDPQNEENDIPKDFLNTPSPLYQTLHWNQTTDGKIQTKTTKCTY